MLSSKALRRAHATTQRTGQSTSRDCLVFIHILAKQDGGLSSRDFCNTFCRQKKSTQKLLKQRFLEEQSTLRNQRFCDFRDKKGTSKTVPVPVSLRRFRKFARLPAQSTFFFNFFSLKIFFRPKIFFLEKIFAASNFFKSSSDVNSRRVTL